MSKNKSNSTLSGLLRKNLKEVDVSLMSVAQKHSRTIKTWHEYVQFLRKFNTKQELADFLRGRNEATEDGQLIRLTISHFDAFKGLVGYLGAALSEAAKDEEPPADDAAAEGGEEGGAPPADPKDLTVKFDHNRAHRYNKAEFTNNIGLVKKVTKDGLEVTVQPDQVDIFVNFEDLIENTTILAKNFFRDKR